MDMQKIGTFLAQLRREQNITQEQLGEKLSVTNKTVSRWEKWKLSAADSELSAVQ